MEANMETGKMLKLTDQWQQLEIAMELDRPGGIFTYPVQTVSQSESGFELVHQSVCVQPHWQIQGDADGQWSCRFKLKLLAGAQFTTSEADQAVAQG